jgi:hypothetical protein
MRFTTKFIGQQKDQYDWDHYAWTVTINSATFTYRMGLAHKTRFGQPTPPKQDDVLHSLFMDAQCGSLSFNDFCSEFGYDNDSLKAFDTYRGCMESGEKLRKALGSEYTKEKERIEALEL